MYFEGLKITNSIQSLDSWAPSSSASKASGIGLTMGAGFLLVASPALARADELIAVQALQREMLFFLGAVACLPALLLVAACTLRMVVSMLTRHWSPVVSLRMSMASRTWRPSRAFVNIPALPTGPQAYHVSFPEFDSAPIGSGKYGTDRVHAEDSGMALELERQLRAAS